MVDKHSTTNNCRQAFVIDLADNVATALCQIEPGDIQLTGEGMGITLTVTESIPDGHKVALKKISMSDPIVKYGMEIGRATQPIESGCWVHLHCMKSGYDKRSSHMDAVTGAPGDTRYE